MDPHDNYTFRPNGHRIQLPREGQHPLAKQRGRWLNTRPRRRDGNTNMANCIEIEHVSKSYGPVMALSDLNFEIPVGGRFALLGPNGAGKSTTLKLLVGSLRPDSGYVKILGSSPE